MQQVVWGRAAGQGQAGRRSGLPGHGQREESLSPGELSSQEHQGQEYQEDNNYYHNNHVNNNNNKNNHNHHQKNYNHHNQEDHNDHHKKDDETNHRVKPRSSGMFHLRQPFLH